MAKIIKERVTAVPEGDFVVFLIGMRVNNFFAVHRWIPVVIAMSKMLKELFEHPELGFKSFENGLGRTLIMVQYWESVDKLMDYAKAKDSDHLPAWKAFNRLASKSKAVGIYHETYVITRGNFENIYVNMPKFGLGKVADLHKVSGKKNTAQQRLSAK